MEAHVEVQPMIQPGVTSGAAVETLPPTKVRPRQTASRRVPLLVRIASVKAVSLVVGRATCGLVQLS